MSCVRVYSTAVVWNGGVETNTNFSKFCIDYSIIIIFVEIVSNEFSCIWLVYIY